MPINPVGPCRRPWKTLRLRRGGGMGLYRPAANKLRDDGDPCESLVEHGSAQGLAAGSPLADPCHPPVFCGAARGSTIPCPAARRFAAGSGPASAAASVSASVLRRGLKLYTLTLLPFFLGSRGKAPRRVKNGQQINHRGGRVGGVRRRRT